MSFQNIQLLDCNRTQSNQAESNDDSNYSIWTNRLGKTIELDVGDTVELQSAFINQRGCADPNSIEFRGQALGVNVKLTETQSVSPDVHVYTQLPSSLDYSTPNFKPTDENIIQGNLGFRYIQNNDVEKVLRDNEAHLEVSYYKTSNGEETIMMPRAYHRERDLTGRTGLLLQSYGNSEYWNMTDIEWDYNGGSYTGTTFGNFSGLPLLTPHNRNSSVGDTISRNIVPIFNTNDWECRGEFPTAGESVPNFGYNFWIMKPRNDNSKFTLFEREFDFTTWSQINEADPLDTLDTFEPSYTFNYEDSGGASQSYKWSSKTWFELAGNRPAEWPSGYTRVPNQQPAEWRYVKKIDLVKISIEKGFNSPESISDQITQQLQAQRSDEPTRYTGVMTNKNSVLPEERQSGLFTYETGVSVETPTYKPVLSSNYVDLSRTSFQNYFAPDGHASLDNRGKEAFAWWRSFHNIYVKRPEIFIAGRKCNSRKGLVYDPRVADSNEDDDIDLTGKGSSNVILNTILRSRDGLDNNRTDKIITSWIWNSTNLKRLKDLFDAQGKYPDLFKGRDNSYGANEVYTNRYLDASVNIKTDFETDKQATIDNSRFLHINRYTNSLAGNFSDLGDDGFTPFTYTTTNPAGETVYFNRTHMTMPVFFYYQKENKDKLTSGEDTTDLCYGFASKSRATRYADIEREYITIHPEMLNGIRKEAFEIRGGYTIVGGVEQEDQPGDIFQEGCMIGWDYHFNSFGNLCLLKDTGMIHEDPEREGEFGSTYPNTFFDQQLGTITNRVPSYSSAGPPPVDSTKYKINRTIRLSYMGANNIACKYDNTDNKFFFEYLHSPERIQNNWNALKEYGTTKDTIPLANNSGQEVYKINKRLLGNSWNPDMCPHLLDDEVNYSTGTDGVAVRYPQSNINMEKFIIFDSKMGVNINFGKTADVDKQVYSKSQSEIWNNSLLGILGFSYEQFNPKEIIETENGASARVKFGNVRSIYNPTTNANVVNTDTEQYNITPYGAIRYTTQTSYSPIARYFYYNSYMDGEPETTLSDVQYFPAISEQTQSVKLKAVNLPRVVLKPYMTIRTDILSQDRYIGGLNSGLVYPIIASVNRINAEKDFVQLDGSETFTITNPTKFSSITTAITDPDGRLSLLDEGSSVIYKITKQDNLENYNVIGRMEAKLKKK